MPVELTSRTVQIAGVELDYLENLLREIFCELDGATPAGARQQTMEVSAARPPSADRLAWVRACGSLQTRHPFRRHEEHSSWPA